jgi:hypothetical protein
MNPISNPYSPGAGSPPPELAGRDKLRDRVKIAIARIRVGNAAKNVLMIGLRGVGKTVLLERMRQDAEAEGFVTVRVETPENRSLPALLAPRLRVALLKMSRVAAATALAQRALRALAGFAKALKFKYNDIEVGLSLDPEEGLADNGDLEGDLTVLLEQVGYAAKSAGTAVVLFIDEVQYVKTDQFAALISALHRCSQLSLPVTMVGAGLPQLPALAGEAKSYAERLFDFPTIGPLGESEAEQAIVKPAQNQGVQIEDAAAKEIIRQSHGYPYFLQEWGKHSWDVAAQSPITLQDVQDATVVAVAELDESFFKVRFDRLTPKEKLYLRTMAELGAGPHRSGEIAKKMKKSTSALGPLRQGLLEKGMIWAPSHGETAFTVPLFDEFMKRSIAKAEWLSELKTTSTINADN